MDPKLRFDIFTKAAVSNFKLLKSTHFDLKALCNRGKGRSAITFGSEFKEIEDLERLLKRHPRWRKLKDQLTNGATFYVEDLDEEIRRKDVRMAYTRGNHKSAEKYNEFLAKAIKKEIMRGWNLILPGDCHEHLLEIVLNPMGVATHLGVT